MIQFFIWWFTLTGCYKHNSKSSQRTLPILNNFAKFSKELYHQHKEKVLPVLLIPISLFIYFSASYLTAERNFHFLNTSVDSFFPLIPIFILVYISMYFFAALPFILIKDKEHSKKLFFVYLGVLSFSFLIFLMYPVVMLRPAINPSFFGNLISLLYGIDIRANNCFPSLHASITFLAGMALYNYNKKYSWALVWAGLIILSTLLIKQHYFLDVLGGLVLGMVSYWFFIKGLNKQQN